MPRARPPTDATVFFSVPFVRKVVRFKRVYTTTRVWMCAPNAAPAMTRSHTFRAVLSGKSTGDVSVVFMRILVDVEPMCTNPYIPDDSGVFFFFLKSWFWSTSMTLDYVWSTRDG